MLERQGSAIRGTTQRWRMVLKGLGTMALGLPMGLPLFFCVCFDGTRDYSFADLGIVAALGLVAIMSLCAGFYYCVLKVLRPNELEITTSGIALTRFGGRKAYTWAELGEARPISAGRGQRDIVMKIIANGKSLLFSADDYGCKGREIADIIAHARCGRLVSSREWHPAPMSKNSMIWIAIAVIPLIPIMLFVGVRLFVRH
ncbi:hypothetical protein [Novosphingobium sp. FSW06-99]|uniref:hypothetical protein n=1 Tax=Novosphingobium sp. FSW06-99 TaxID=1739113 RepID=UPI00076D3E92|nr:hypothetical protein [Novosphingobium sp. FSW06-99]KUR70669.1 hypothetical protein AQZ49_21420 [Novosphingobium sp. FSW06-99]